MAWIKDLLLKHRSKPTIDLVIKTALGDENNYEKVLVEMFQSLKKNGFFNQNPEAWQHQILNAIKALPDINQKPVNDATVADGGSRKRRIVISDENVRRSKRLKRPNTRYLDI